MSRGKAVVPALHIQVEGFIPTHSSLVVLMELIFTDDNCQHRPPKQPYVYRWKLIDSEDWLDCNGVFLDEKHNPYKHLKFVLFRPFSDVEIYWQDGKVYDSSGIESVVKNVPCLYDACMQTFPSSLKVSQLQLTDQDSIYGGSLTMIGQQPIPEIPVVRFPDS